MKIAYVFPPIWNPRSDGSLSIWNHEVTRHLANFCEITVYGARSRFERKEQVYEGVVYRGVRIPFDRRFQKLLALFGWRKSERPVFSSDLFYIGYALVIAFDLRKRKCDIIHVYNYPQFIPILKKFNPSARIVLNMHGEWLTQFKWRKIDDKLRKADLIIGCSEFVTEKIRQRFPQLAHQCKTVFMGVDPGHFCPGDSPKKKMKESSPRLLYVGRLSPEKGLHILLDAFKKIILHYPQAILEIVGPEWIMPKEWLIDLSEDSNLSQLKLFYSDNYIHYLREQIPPDLTDRILFRGLVSHADVVNYYRSADVFVNPSFYESFGMSVIEAMACQCAVVGTRVGGAAGIITEGKTGILVEPGNVSALADAILSFLGDESLRRSMGAAARKRAIDTFSWERVCESLTRSYTNIAEMKT